MNHTYNPSSVGIQNGNIFGLPFGLDDSEIILLPVPWDVTTSYQAGTANGPEAILNASPQLDLYDMHYPNTWKKGIYMLPIQLKWTQLNAELRPLAQQYIQILESGQKPTPKDLENLTRINNACKVVKNEIKELTHSLLRQGKKVGIVGGEHSIPLGYLEALADRYEHFGILQIDAHFDLRKAYEEFTYSHASIMYNALLLPHVTKLVSVGIRDFCEEEYTYVQQSDGRIIPFYDQQLHQQLFVGVTWKNICQSIVSQLPDTVYVSFDIDGLDPSLCPDTGTPVPGGLTYNQITFLIQTLKESGKKIIGFDLCEVSPGSRVWNGNVGARILYQLCHLIS